MINKLNIVFPILLFLVLLSGISYGSDISVQLSGTIEKIESYKDGRLTYFSLSGLASILGERISWEKVGLSAKYVSDDYTITFFLNSPYIRVNDSIKNLIYPVQFKKGNLFLPIKTFLPIYDLIHPDRITWDSDRKLIRIDSEYYNVTDLAFAPKANGLLIELFINEPKEYEIYITEGNWLNISVLGGTVNRRQVLSGMDRKYLRDINVVQFEQSAQVSLRMRQNITKYTDRFQSSPGRVQISLIDPSVAVIGTRPHVDIGPDDLINKIIVDAGHGGEDYGAIGLNGSSEKKIVLDIAKRLAKLIRKDKIFEVVMTREKDVSVSLDKRTQIANEANGDLFVSIHSNASLNKSARGFQIFYLAPAWNDEARASAQLENASFLSEINSGGNDDEDDLTFILSDMIQTEFQTESADLAAMVDKEFRKKLKKETKARGIDQAGFYVLNGVYMPSLLVESAFLTNKADEKLLKKKKFRQKIAEGIYEGLKRFKMKYESQ
ncbi:MAG: hypothetical protein GY865_02260 [candidate division Zixibacteria bacterium]|nr:hypothetical protein [candidate division Zixibacteria bacterium]